MTFAPMLQALFQRLRRWDPSTDPRAEPVSTPALVALAIGIALNLAMFLRWRYQPMQDFPFHVACGKYVADWGRSDSLYTELFARPDLLSANTLLYSIGGTFGKWFDVLGVMRFLVASVYIVGYPLATLYALRVFGRSAWGAVLSNALVFERFYVAGFVNELVAFPIALFLFARFYLLLRAPTARGAVLIAAGLCTLFFAHSFVFMWTGVVLAMMSIVAVPFVLRRGLRPFAWAALMVALSALPSLIFAVRWVMRSSSRFGVGGETPASTMTFIEPGDAFQRIYDFVIFSHAPKEGWLLVGLLVLVGASLALARLERRAAPPALEIITFATFASYFVLPIYMKGESVVNMRQLLHAIWLAPVLVTPVSARASRVARWAIVGGILLFCYARTSLWRAQLVAFERDEADGLQEVLAAAPPGLRLYYPIINVESKHLYGKTLWHVEGYYVGAGGGLIRDIPGADDPAWWLHFNPGHTGLPHYVGSDSHGWSQAPGIWETYDLVLVHGWQPSAEALAAARAHATRIIRRGGWELWQKKP